MTRESTGSERSLRQNKMNAELTRLVSGAINELANQQSLISVTRIDVSPNFSGARVHLSIIPEDQKDTALAFIRRHAHDIRKVVKKRIATRTIPFFTFYYDGGDMRRQKIFDTIDTLDEITGAEDIEEVQREEEV